MSNERDEILRRLEETGRQLQAAHADFVQANQASQRALERIMEAFATATSSVVDLVSQLEPISTEDSKKEAPPVADQGPESPPLSLTPPTPQDVDQEQNTLPARLHSRGVSYPLDMATDVSTAEPTKERRKPVAARPAGLLLECPRLVLSPASATVFPGIDKDKRIVVTNDGFGVGPLLTDLLAKKGYRVRLESRRPELSAPADVVIFLGSLRSPSNLDDAMSVVEDAMATAEKMTTRLMQPGSGFVAVVDTAGGFGLDDFDPVAAPFGALLGLVRLIDSRHPGAHTKLIDLDGRQMQTEQIAGLLVDELLGGGAQSPVALGQEGRRSVEWTEFSGSRRTAPWFEEQPSPIVYMPGPEAILATAVERLAIAHELPVAILRRAGAPAKLVRDFGQSSIDARSTEYDLNRLFSVMDFFDRLRADHGPIGAVVTESFPASSRDAMGRWETMRPALDEFNALLAMTINDPLHLLAVGLGPQTPPVVSAAIRYFARAESLRRNEYLHVRLAHLKRPTSRQRQDLDPGNFALTEFLSSDLPDIAEIRISGGRRTP